MAVLRALSLMYRHTWGPEIPERQLFFGYAILRAIAAQLLGVNLFKGGVHFLVEFLLPFFH